MIFVVLFVVSLFVEFFVNDKFILVSYCGELCSFVLLFYFECDFGGDFLIEVFYLLIEVECFIVIGGLVECFDMFDELVVMVKGGDSFEFEDFVKGWMIWLIIFYFYNIIVDIVGVVFVLLFVENWLGIDDMKCDVVVWVIYGFCLLVLFVLIIVMILFIIGILVGVV